MRERQEEECKMRKCSGEGTLLEEVKEYREKEWGRGRQEWCRGKEREERVETEWKEGESE